MPKLGAADLPSNRVDYANNVRVHVSMNEVILDFFFISPNPQKPNDPPQVTHIQRMILPPNIAKESADNLITSMLLWEDTMSENALPEGDTARTPLWSAAETKDLDTTINENVWQEFDALMERLEASGEVITSLDDENLGDFRSSWDNRLRSLYESHDNQ